MTPVVQGNVLHYTDCEASLARRHAGAPWASLPTELLRAILLDSDTDTVKVARLVCKGWRSVHPRLQPSVPVHVPTRRRCPRQPFGGASARAAAGRSRGSAPARAGSESTRRAAAPAPNATQRAADLLSWISGSFHGELEQDGRVVLTLVQGDDGGSAVETAAAIPRMRAFPLSLSDDAVAASAGAACRAEAHGGGAAAPPSGARPLRDLLQYLAAVAAAAQPQHHLQHLRVQHSAAAPTEGLAAAALPCSCSSASGGACTPCQASGCPLAAFLPASAAVLAPARPACAPAALPLAACDAADCSHCCCGAAAAQPTAQRHLLAPGLGAVVALRRLRSLELSGVRVGAGLLGRLTALSQLTRLCFDSPVPTNRVAVLAGLTSLECLHFTITWPAQPPKAGTAAAGTQRAAAVDEGGASARAAAAAAAAAGGAPGEDALGSDGDGDSGGDAGASAHSDTDTDGNLSSSESESDSDSAVSGDMGESPPLTRSRDDAAALTMESVAAALAALAPLRRLTHLRLRVSCRHMGRAFLLPPALLQHARAALPRLRRFAFHTLSNWQPVPRTLYNWAAADPGIGGELCCIRESPADRNQSVFIWQDFDWRLREPRPPPPPPPPPLLAQAPPPPALSPRGRQRDDCSDCGGAWAGAGGGLVAAAAPDVADVSVGVRTSCNSWLGSCMGAAAALNAVAGSLPGCRLASLVLQDPQNPPDADTGLLAGGELLPATLEAVSELRSLALLDIQRPPCDSDAARSALQVGGLPDAEPPDVLLQLLQLPSLRALELQTNYSRWLDAVLPQPQQGPQPAAESPTGRPPAPARSGAAAERAAGELSGSAGGGAAPSSPSALLPQGQSQRALRRSAAPVGWGSGGVPLGLEHLSLECRRAQRPAWLRGRCDVEAYEGLEEEEEEECRYRPEGDGGPGGGRGRAGASATGLGGPRLRRRHPLSRLSLLAALRSLHLDVTGWETAYGSLLQVSWLPPSLEHLSLAGVTLRLPPPRRPSGATAGTAAAATSVAVSPLLPHLASLSALSCALPHLAALLPAAGCSHLTRLSLAGCRTAASATPSAPSGPTHRAAQLLLVAELEALVGCCGASLRSLRVTQQPQQPAAEGSGGARDAAQGRVLHVGSSAGSARLLIEALPRLPRLQALCWEVEAELQDRLLAGLSVLRELRELGVCGHVGPAGQASLAQLSGLRSLVQLCPSRQGRQAEAWMRQLAPRLPLCVFKCLHSDRPSD